ncbi:MAG: fasciclin domain-containing protein [Leeuwenhoekiella sp.]
MKKIFLSMAVVAFTVLSCNNKPKTENAEVTKEGDNVALSSEGTMKDAMTATDTLSMASKTVADIAMSDDNFSTLVTAVKAAGLAETLQGQGPFTIFAPTNAAFNKLPEGTLDNLIKEENKAKLASILKYHVVSGEFKAADVIKAIKDNNGSYEISTLGGDKIVATLDGDKVILTDAKGDKATVVQTDVDGSNGVIHAIDTVLMPGK